MKLQYDTYTHAIDEAEVSISRVSKLADNQTMWGHTERWEIKGFLQADTQADLTTALDSLESAYSQNGGDLRLLFDDGTETQHVLSSANVLGGVTILEQPHYPEGKGAEYSTFRRYRIVAEAFVEDGTPPNILEWDETISFSGGGPRDVYIELRNGPPQFQNVSEMTPFVATQIGRAVGRVAWPVPPSPFAPAAENRPARRIEVGSPKYIRGAQREFPVTWAYQFHSAAYLSGLPTPRP